MTPSTCPAQGGQLGAAHEHRGGAPPPQGGVRAAIWTLTRRQAWWVGGWVPPRGRIQLLMLCRIWAQSSAVAFGAAG
jgi:hypothetical protein